MTDSVMTILTFGAGLLAIVVSTYGAILTAKVSKWSEAKLAEHGLAEAAKWQADLKAGLLTGAKAALLEGKSIPEAIKAAIAHTLKSNVEAAANLKPGKEVLENLAKAAVADAVKQAAGSIPEVEQAVAMHDRLKDIVGKL